MASPQARRNVVESSEEEEGPPAKKRRLRDLSKKPSSSGNRDASGAHDDGGNPTPRPRSKAQAKSRRPSPKPFVARERDGDGGDKQPSIFVFQDVRGRDTAALVQAFSDHLQARRFRGEHLKHLKGNSCVECARSKTLCERERHTKICRPCSSKGWKCSFQTSKCLGARSPSTPLIPTSSECRTAKRLALLRHGRRYRHKRSHPDRPNLLHVGGL